MYRRNKGNLFNKFVGKSIKMSLADALFPTNVDICVDDGCQRIVVSVVNLKLAVMITLTEKTGC